MPQDEFHLKWEKDEKHRLLESVESEYEEIVWEQAVKLYEETLAKQPDNPEYLHSYGYLMEMKAVRLLHAAAKSYEKGLQSDLIQEKYSWIRGKLHFQLIAVRNRLSENHKSVEFYKQQLTESPDDPDIYCCLMQCYLNADQIQEASRVAEAGLKAFPHHAMLAYYQGETFSRLGRIDEALAAWETSAKLDEQLIDGRFSRAFLLEREHRLAECAEEWEKIVAFLEKYHFADDYPKRELQRVIALIKAD